MPRFLAVALRNLAAVAVLCLASAWPLAAHGIRPVIIGITVGGTEVEINVNVAIEAIIVGMDLSTLEDTDLHPLADRYDALRAENPAKLEVALRAVWPELAERITILAGETRLTPELAGLSTPDAPDLSQPRLSDVRIVARLPPDGSPVQVGFDPGFGPIVIEQTGGDDDAYVGVLENGELSAAIPRVGYVSQGALPVFGRFMISGFEHIIPKGLDHILFVLGLFFYSLRIGPLLGQVTAFTLAHTVTLAAASLGIVSLPPVVVEPLIAASIVYVAVENILAPQRGVGWGRIAVVFCFGLLHGLGFASVLGDVGLPDGRFAVALIGFNIGVELGQLAVIAVAFLLLALPFGRKDWYRSAIAIPASVVIAGVGAWWTVERVFL